MASLVSLCLPIVLAACFGLLHPSAAEAASTTTLLAVAGPSPVGPAKRPPLTIKVSETAPETGQFVTISGRANTRLVNQHVVLQQRSGTSWTVVSSTRLAHSRYAMSIAAPDGSTRFRVAGVASGNRKRVTSAAITVTWQVVPPPVQASLADVQARILKDTNAYRSQAGLELLTYDPAISEVAVAWSKDMAGRESMDHNPDYAWQIPPGWTRAGENIAVGYDYASVTLVWFNSPGHRANMLGDYTAIGIGYAVSANGSPYYTQNFAKY